MTDAYAAYKEALTAYSDAQDKEATAKANYEAVDASELEAELAKAKKEASEASALSDDATKLNGYYTEVSQAVADENDTAIDSVVTDAAKQLTTLNTELTEATAAVKTSKKAWESETTDETKKQELMDAYYEAQGTEAVLKERVKLYQNFINIIASDEDGDGTYTANDTISFTTDQTKYYSTTLIADKYVEDSAAYMIAEYEEAAEKAQTAYDNVATLKEAYESAKTATSDALTAKQNAWDTYQSALKTQDEAEDTEEAKYNQLTKVKNNADGLIAGTVTVTKTDYPDLYALDTAISDAETALEEAKKAKSEAYQEYDLANETYTRAKAAYQASKNKLSKPVITVKAGKKCVKISWKKVSGATKYKLRIKKGNGKYKSYYTKKTSYKVKVKKGTKVKVCVRAQKGSTVSKYSTKKSARAK